MIIAMRASDLAFFIALGLSIVTVGYFAVGLVREFGLRKFLQDHLLIFAGLLVGSFFVALTVATIVGNIVRDDPPGDGGGGGGFDPSDYSDPECGSAAYQSEQRGNDFDSEYDACRAIKGMGD